MPKNIGGGKRYKKRKTKGPEEPGPLMYADAEQEYGIVTKRLGNGQLELMISKDGSEPRRALGKIRGILRKRRVPFHIGSIVIVSGREFLTSATVGKDDNAREKVDVLHCYYDDQAKRLFSEKKIPMKFQSYINTETEGKKGEGECDILFAVDDGDDSDDEAGEDINIDDL